MVVAQTTWLVVRVASQWLKGKGRPCCCSIATKVTAETSASEPGPPPSHVLHTQRPSPSLPSLSLSLSLSPWLTNTNACMLKKSAHVRTDRHVDVVPQHAHQNPVQPGCIFCLYKHKRLTRHNHVDKCHKNPEMVDHIVTQPILIFHQYNYYHRFENKPSKQIFTRITTSY